MVCQPRSHEFWQRNRRLVSTVALNPLYKQLISKFSRSIKIPTTWYLHQLMLCRTFVSAPFLKGRSTIICYSIMKSLTVMHTSRAILKPHFAEKPDLKCYKCSTVYHYRIKRNWFVKYFLFFLPIKIYFCGRCVKNRYLLLTDKGERRYKPV
jgi:hypothetical protein